MTYFSIYYKLSNLVFILIYLIEAFIQHSKLINFVINLFEQMILILR